MAPGAASAQAGEDVTSIRFNLDARYDSNIARSSEATAIARGLEREEIQFSPSVRFDIARSFGQTRATLSGLIGYDFHARNSELDSERIDLQGGLTTRAGPCQAKVETGFSRRQSNLGDIAFIAVAPLARAENIETVQRYSGELACGSQYGLRPYGAIEYERGDNSAAIRERADYDSTTYTAGLKYISPTLGDISAFTSRRDVDLRGPRLPGDPAAYRETRIGAKYERNIGTRLDLSAEVANSEVNARGPGAAIGFNGLTWNIRLTALVGSRLRVSGRLGREISNSLSSDSTFVISSPYDLRVNYAVNERWQLEAGAALTRQRYRYAVQPALVFIERDRRELFDAGVNYKFARRLNLRVSGGVERRRANDPIFNYNNSFAMASLGFQL